MQSSARASARKTATRSVFTAFTRALRKLKVIAALINAHALVAQQRSSHIFYFAGCMTTKDCSPGGLIRLIRKTTMVTRFQKFALQYVSVICNANFSTQRLHLVLATVKLRQIIIVIVADIESPGDSVLRSTGEQVNRLKFCIIWPVMTWMVSGHSPDRYSRSCSHYDLRGRCEEANPKISNFWFAWPR